MRICASLLAFPILLLACAGPEGEAPSLAPRPIEGILDQPVHAIEPVESVDNAALAAEIETLVGRAEAGHHTFSARYPATRDAVTAASGAALESESWIAAQLALSALDSARSSTVEALGMLDGILAEQALAGAPSETQRLLAARERVSALYEDQNALYDPLNRMLRTR